MKMFLFWCVFVLSLSASESGFVGVNRDHVVGDVGENLDGDSLQTKIVESNARFGDDTAERRELIPGGEDLVFPLLTGVLMKVLTLLPLVLMTLALVAGFSLAASKVALLLGGGLLMYQYISQTQQLLVPVAKKGGFHPGVPSFHPPALFTHPELPEYIRDRNIDTNTARDP